MSQSQIYQEVTVLILAAGMSTRMRGRDKLLEVIDGKTLLRRVADIACATGSKVFVTLPLVAPDRYKALVGLDVEIIEVGDADNGMAASLRAWGRQSKTDPDGLMIMLADMPEVTTGDLHNLMQAFADSGNNRIIRATDTTQKSGHPVIFPNRLLHRFTDLTGDQGARSLLRDEDVLLVTLPDAHATTDLDTPEQWQTWRKHYLEK